MEIIKRCDNKKSALLWSRHGQLGLRTMQCFADLRFEKQHYLSLLVKPETLLYFLKNKTFYIFYIVMISFYLGFCGTSTRRHAEAVGSQHCLHHQHQDSQVAE